MKHDEFSFLNLQLAGMLRSGIPLEGALKQLCATLHRGKFREEFAALESDLASGTSLEKALEKRNLPEFYRQMLRVGVRGRDLPGVLTLVADYYQRLGFLSSRLKGLMIYPGLVLLLSLGLSLYLTLVLRPFLLDDLVEAMGVTGAPVIVWTPLILLSAATVGLGLVWASKRLRQILRWRLPGFKEAALSQVASSLGLLLRSGAPLGDALGFMRALEPNAKAGNEIARWQAELASGFGDFSKIGAGSKLFPPLFLWLVKSGGEDLSEGFRRTSEIYYARALHRTEMLLYAALPVSVVLLGVIVVSQAYPLLVLFFQFGNVLDQMGM